MMPQQAKLCKAKFVNVEIAPILGIGLCKAYKTKT